MRGTLRTMALLTTVLAATLALTGGTASAQSISGSLGGGVVDPSPANIAEPAPAGKVTVGAGVSFGTGTPVGPDRTPKPFDHCTITAVGSDNLGNLVALSAAHCAIDSVTGQPIELWVEGQKVGQFESWKYTIPNGLMQFGPGFYDFAFARLDASKVHISSARGANVAAGLLAENDKIPGGFTVCISGRTSGQKCGKYLGDGRSHPREHVLGFAVRPGDSGGPLYTPDGRLLGIASRILPGSFYGDVRDAAAYAASKGWVGGGFRPIG